MNNKRRAIIILSSVAIIGVLTLIIATHPLAQQPPVSPPTPGGEPPAAPPTPGGAPPMAPSMPSGGPPMPVGALPGMMGPGMMGPGMVGAGGAGVGTTNLRWEEHKMPEEKTMTYPEWLDREGRRPVAIPRWFLREEDGKPKQYTDAQWHQLYALYTGVKEEPGAPGSKLSREIQKQLAVQQKEAKLPRLIYEAGLDHFYFRVTYPTYNIGQVTEAGTTISLDAIMQVPESFSRNYGEWVRKRLAPYSNPGPNRTDFYLVTYQRGYWRPYHFQLLPETISELNQLWAGNTIKLELLDKSGAVIASQTQPAGHSAETMSEIAYPPEIDLNPGYEYLTEAQQIDFAGNKLPIHNIHGWRYSFSFNLSLEQLARLHKVRVQLLDIDGEVRSESTIVGTSKAPYAGTLGGGRAAAPTGPPSAGMLPTVPGVAPPVGPPGPSGAQFGPPTPAGPPGPSAPIANLPPPPPPPVPTRP